MLHNLRQRAGDERGFTLIELLVVILIIGILAAIALPSFLNQREKGQDTEAKSFARSAQTAMETWYTDNQNYNATVANLTAIEPSLTDANSLAVAPAASGDGYTVTVTSRSTDATTFSIVNNAGDINRTCSAPADGGCLTGGTW